MDACEACKLKDRLRIELRHWCCAGLLSLTDMTTRLQQDHDNALMLAKGLAACLHIDIRTDLVRKAVPLSKAVHPPSADHTHARV